MRTIYLLLVFFIAASCASEFQGHGIYFEIPEGWHVAENNSTNINDTKIVITDNRSAIRIDLVKFPELGVLRNISSIEEGSMDQIIRDYYTSEVLNPNKGKNWGSANNIRSISSTDQVNPDGVGNNVMFGTDMWDPSSRNSEGVGHGGEWFFAWSKKEYGDKLIGVHALFDGNYSVVDLSYNHDWVYPAPVPVVELLNSIRTNMSEVSGIEARMWEFDSRNPLTSI